MTRPLRIHYPDAIYHVTVRGNERKEIFQDARDRRRFLDLLRQSATIYRVRLFSYVLMENHFHLLLQTPLANLADFMRHFNISYTGYYNRTHRRVGHLYQGRYRSILVDKEAYLSLLSRYIHLNPIRIRAMEGRTAKERGKYLQEYEWSSLRGYLNSRKREECVDYRMILEEYGGDNEQGRKAYQQTLEGDLSDGLQIKDKILGQSLLGRDEFVAWVKEKFLRGKTDRECPSFREIQRYRAQEEILRAIEKETGKGLEEIRGDRGTLRQMAMDLLYRVGGLKGAEIGRLLGVDYSTVSQGRKRLREKMKEDAALKRKMDRMEGRLST